MGSQLACSPHFSLNNFILYGFGRGKIKSAQGHGQIRLFMLSSGSTLSGKAGAHGFPNPDNARLWEGLARNFQMFVAPEFLAEVAQHIPDWCVLRACRGDVVMLPPQERNDAEREPCCDDGFLIACI